MHYSLLFTVLPFISQYIGELWGLVGYSRRCFAVATNYWQECCCFLEDDTLNRVDFGRTDINQVLSEMRALKSRAQGSFYVLRTGIRALTWWILSPLALRLWIMRLKNTRLKNHFPSCPLVFIVIPIYFSYAFVCFDMFVLRLSFVTSS